MKRWGFIVVVLFGAALFASPASAITIEEILKLKRAGLSDETIQRYIKLEMLRLKRKGPDHGAFMGRRTVVGPDGKKKVIIYSIEDPAEAQEEERKQDDAERRSWEMLKGLVIDAR